MPTRKPYINKLKDIARTTGRIVNDLQDERDLRSATISYQSNNELPIPPTNITYEAGVECVIAAWGVMIIGESDLEDGYIDDDASDDPGATVENAILKTVADSDSCMDFDWLDGNRYNRINFGIGYGVGADPFCFGLDDIENAFQTWYSALSGLWLREPIEFWMPVWDHPTWLQRSILTPDADAVAYPRGFRIDPVSVGVDWQIVLQQLLSYGLIGLAEET